MTVRDHLATVRSPRQRRRPAAVTACVAVPPPAAELAAVYELARYSGHAVEAAEAHRFEALARGFDES